MLQQHNRLKNFAVEFVREVRICVQYSLTVHQNRTWQNLNILIINAKKHQKRIKKSIRFMKRRWLNKTMNQLMFEIRNHYIANEIVKLIKEYFINFEKIMKRLQLIVLKYKKNESKHSNNCYLYFDRLQTRSQQNLFWFFYIDSKESSRYWFNDQRYEINKRFSSKCFLIMILLKAFQSLQADSILLKLTFRFFWQEQLFLNSQFQKLFLSFRARRRKSKELIN